MQEASAVVKGISDEIKPLSEVIQNETEGGTDTKHIIAVRHQLRELGSILFRDATGRKRREVQ